MATVEWTDARLNDAFERLHAEMVAMRADMREMRAEAQATRRDLRAEMLATRGELRAEVQASHSDLRAEVHASRSEFAAELRDVRSGLRAIWITLAAGYAGIAAAVAGAVLAAQL